MGGHLVATMKRGEESLNEFGCIVNWICDKLL
jgi:hypothetical protein